MTSLVAWVGIDARGPASIYIASDSRVTSGNGSIKQDDATKTYCSSKYPIIFGYCGDVLAATKVISDMIKLIDRGLLLLSGDVFEKTSHIMAETANIQAAMADPYISSYSLLIGFREGEGFGTSKFEASKINFDRSTTKFTFECIDLYREKSFLIFADGSGAGSVLVNHRLWEKTAQARTSRAVYGAFCDALGSGSDEFSGGAPQIVGLYRIGYGRLFGTKYKDQLYFNGKSATAENIGDVIEWRDELFQRIDPATGQLCEGAQVHTR
jgi:hypothetical protein